jgi:hypothetical protein
VSAYEYSLQNGDYAYFLWSGFIVFIGLLAAGAALKGWVRLVWGCAGLLGVLSILGALSIGFMVAPLALVLFVSAILLSLSGPEGSGGPTCILGLLEVWFQGTGTIRHRSPITRIYVRLVSTRTFENAPSETV